MSMIESPFNLGTDKDFEKEIKALIKKYGYTQYFVTVAEPFDEDQTDYWSFWGADDEEGVCEAMVEQLEDVTSYLRDAIDKDGEVV